METPRQQRAIFSVPQEQDKPNSLCLVDDVRREALVGTPRRYQEFLFNIPSQDAASPYRLMALAAIAQDYVRINL